MVMMAPGYVDLVALAMNVFDQHMPTKSNSRKTGRYKSDGTGLTRNSKEQLP
jgi:hypothetical protein